jgi:hypothetical protein
MSIYANETESISVGWLVFSSLLEYGCSIGAAYTAASVFLTIASPWVQMGIFIGFLMFFKFIETPLHTPQNPWLTAMLAAIITGALATIVCSIAIGCGMPFWCGFSAMSAVQVAAICSPPLIALGFLIVIPLAGGIACAPILCISACCNSRNSTYFGSSTQEIDDPGQKVALLGQSGAKNPKLRS